MPHLVLPGNHSQFAQYLRRVYGSGGGIGQPPARPLLLKEHLRGIAVQDVTTFIMVGTYWDNPVWGSDEYHWFMAEAMEYGMPWAMAWPEDFNLAQERRNPLNREEMIATRRSLKRLEKELSDD